MAQLCERIRGEAGAQNPFDIGRDHAPPIRQKPRTGQTRRQWRHARTGLQWITGRDHQPHLVQPKRPHGMARDMDMPGMGRVEGPAQKANAAAAAIAKAGWVHAKTINRSGAKVNWPSMPRQPVTCRQKQRPSGLFSGIHLFRPNNPDYASIRACHRVAATDACRASDSLD